ncbi:Sexual differentiation process protein isp4 [Tolypocladium ophioglossoides CBS 100239]|uniref:Sexual differentiation process protein isp4 n=1 Tax=Tolypocladium ophioglossoides (strain CBS 100239) TaxID=1163406 RepID=A0A0L0MXH4_TOLOC|nr:Sexual differentiation process protein isp4 [Tolypocladium ophioglossoides CBS 100239]
MSSTETRPEKDNNILPGTPTAEETPLDTPVAQENPQDTPVEEKPRANSTADSTSSSSSDLVASLERLLEEHGLDQNFPQDILVRARQFLHGRQDSPDADADADVEAARTLLDDFREHKELARNSSAYQEVRAVVDTHDDPALPVGTFRVFLMGTLFAVAGTAMQQFFSLRMPSISISTYVVQLLTMPLGVFLARVLPAREFALPGGRGFTLNPGPFSQKEHLLIAMMANVSFGGHHTSAYIVSIIQVLKLDRFYGRHVLADSIPWQVATLLATQLIGYGCAGLTRRFLVYPPAMIWQKPLANIALTKALHQELGRPTAPRAANGWTISRYRFFVFWVPNYIFEGLGLSNWPTWIAPGSVTLALVAGSTCGLGLNPLPTLDWNIATYLGDPIVTPLFTLMNFSAGMALVGFAVAPVLYFNNVWNGGYLPINSNKVYDNTGHFYQIHRILNADFTINEAAYRAYSVPWLSTTQILNLVAYLAMYVAVPIHVVLWFRKDIMDGLRSIWGRKTRAEQFNDVHNRLMSAYPECPHWWYLIILAASFVLACVSVTVWPTGMPIWGILLAVAFTVLLQVPIGMLAAITNVELPTSILALCIGGYALEGKVIPNMIFKMFSYMSTSQSLNFVSDLKLAHYAKIPPRWAFAAQVYATVLAGFVSLAVNHWVLHHIDDVCMESQKEKFTCLHTHTFFMSSVLRGVVGPRRLFGPGAPYHAITYCIPLGVVLPIVAYVATKRWPASWWRNVNSPIFLAGGLGWAPYNWSYMQGTVVLSLFFNYFVKRRYKGWWERYAYVLASSFTAATGVAGLVLFFSLQKWDIHFNWWGNLVAGRGVDQGGWMNSDGTMAKCANLALPPGGAFGAGF